MDRRWYLDVNRFAEHTGWLHPVLTPYALWGGPVLLVLLLAVGWWHARSGERPVRSGSVAFLTGVGAIVAVLLNQHLVSPLIARPRPCHALHGVQTLLTCSSDYSMPSDHCVIAGAITAGLFLVNRRLGAVAVVLSLLLAFSRVYVGVHYPSDTVVGLVLGAVVCLVAVLALRPVTEIAVRHLSRGPLRRLVVAER